MHSPGPEPAAAAAADGDAVQSRIAALRAQGAARFDPVRWAYIESLARRAAPLQGALRAVLEHKLAQALDGLASRLAAADAAAAAAAAAARPAPDPSTPHRAGPTLADLLRLLDGPAALPSAAGPTAPATQAIPSAGPATAARGELKAVSRFRSTWARLSTDQQLQRALEKVPDNPGPLNSHLLLLRSLKLMQAVSPAYLEHFMAHAEALLWLDAAQQGRMPSTAPQGRVPGTAGTAATAAAPRRESDKKRKPGRGSA